MLDNKNFGVNLSEKEGTIVNVLVANNANIEQMYNNRSVNAIQFKAYIHDLVMAMDDKPLDKKSAGTKRFLMTLNKLRTKNDIITFVWNARLSGDNLGVLKNK